MRRSADVIVTDGFTGNVTLKTLEGAVMGLAGLVFGVVDEPGTPWAGAADALKLRLLEAAAPLLPDNTGGAHAARRRGRVHHLARLVVGDRDRQRGPGRARLRARRRRRRPARSGYPCRLRRTATSGRSAATTSSASCASSSSRSSASTPTRDARHPAARRPRRRRLRGHRSRRRSDRRARRAHRRVLDRRRRPRRAAHRPRRGGVRRASIAARS